MLIAAAIPPFISELKFSGDAFRLSRWRTPETREQLYVETVLAREDHAKEVKLFGLGERFLKRYKAIFEKLYAADRALTIKRAVWAFILGTIGTVAFYGMYLWIALSTIDGAITIGAMTMYVVVFKQAQSAMASALGDIGGMYEDNLYLSNLSEFLDTPTMAPGGTPTTGPVPGDGCASRRSRSSTRAPTTTRSAASRSTSSPAASSPSSARTAPARPRSSSC